VGEVTQTDVLQSQARLEGTKTGLTQAEGQLQGDAAAYLRSVGVPPKAFEEPMLVSDVPDTLEDAVNQAIHKNPSVVAASYGEEAAKAGVDVNKGALLPEVSLVGTVGRTWDQSDFVPGTQDASQIMLRMTIPLYNGGAEYSQIRSSQQMAGQKRLELEDVRLAVRQFAINAWNGLLTARSATLSSEAQVVANKRALEGVKKEASVGTRTTLDVLNAEQELLAAQVNVVQARHDEAVATLQIRAATGTLTAEGLNLPVERYRAEDYYDEAKGKWIGFSADK